MTVLHMDCRDGMRMFPENTFDAIVTDPPYELTSARPGGRSPATEGKVMRGFMGMQWDGSGIAFDVDMWREALRVLKPGGHLLAFSGSRTYHRMVCAIEDAGFEIRDQIMWVYGSGFPKSLDVSKAITAKESGYGQNAEGVRRATMGSEYEPSGVCGNRDGVTRNSDTGMFGRDLPLSDAGRQWQGWGTALKPAHEPICVARKPLMGTVAANVLAHGVGAINIDGCRVPTDEALGRFNNARTEGTSYVVQREAGLIDNSGGFGRWPANLIHDGSDEVIAAFLDAGGQQAATAKRTQGNLYGVVTTGTVGVQPRADMDRSAARFFYCAKASGKDRGEGNTHPTVKPTDLMRYLCRLVTPPGGLILDPFAGSGSTYKAAQSEGFDFIGFELQAEYVEIANKR